jgi:hypothetical protein
MTEEEIKAAALADPDNPPLTPERQACLKRVPQVKWMRRALGLTQEFSGARRCAPWKLCSLHKGRFFDATMPFVRIDPVF